MSDVVQQMKRRCETGLDQILKLAIFAVGGQGGGVLNSWIVNLAEQNGYDAQATSVAGVAQRTGATIYYVEMLPKSDTAPVFSLAPSEGDVDVLIAAELMEAGRAVTRGFVTPNKTKVIASTHRQLATVEKVVPGNGTADGDTVLAAVQEQADTLLAFDMQSIAEEAGTVISAALFGALAGSGALPFDVETFRDTVRASGRGVDRSLAAFDEAFAIATGAKSADVSEMVAKPVPTPTGPPKLRALFEAQNARVGALPRVVGDVVSLGLRKVIEFQDLKYGETYLDRVERAVVEDRDGGGVEKEFAYSVALAKYLANAMSYDDIIRVADAKTKPGRYVGIEAEVGATPTHLTRVTEYTHPGAAEVISLMPRRLGGWIEAQPTLFKAVDRLVNRGRHIRTDRIGGFLSMYLIAGLRPWRRSLLRHVREWQHIGDWLDLAESRLSHDYDLAVATLQARRLIKGYSDTHARGLSKFDKVIEGTRLVEGRSDAAKWAVRLIDAALADPKGEQLDGAIQTIRSFVSGSVEEGRRDSNLTAAE